MTDPLHYATYLDRHYLTRGLALYQSLVHHSPPFVLWVLCLDEEVERMLRCLELEHVRLVPLEELERVDPALVTARAERMPVEYYWTCGPAFLLEVFRRAPQIDMLTYLDADVFFFGDPTSIHLALGDRSILIRQQQVIPTGNDPPRGGKYNVGVLVFRRTDTGIACLGRWRVQCLEWCFDRFEAERHGDQKYLDDWPERYGAVVVRHAGVGVAPWHLAHVTIAQHEDQVMIEGDPLICYHFARVRRINRWMYELHDIMFHHVKASAIVRRHIYAPYLRELYAGEWKLRTVGYRVPGAAVRTRTPGEAMRRARKPGILHTSPFACRRFMFVNGSIAV